jgi:hypothetical protein
MVAAGMDGILPLQVDDFVGRVNSVPWRSAKKARHPVFSRNGTGEWRNGGRRWRRSGWFVASTGPSEFC